MSMTAATMPPQTADDTAKRFQPPRVDFAAFKPKTFLWQRDGKVATITLNRPERKNPLTLESYAELRDTFRDLVYADDIKCIVIAGAGGNFCSGGDVHEIIGPLTKMKPPQLLRFTRMTGDLVKAMRACPQPVVAAVDGVCAGAGAILALFSDLRYGTAGAKVAFLFTRVGLGGCDMGACAMLPRVIGQGRAAELLYTGRSMSGEEALAWGFFNALADAERVLPTALDAAKQLACGPALAHAVTKKMLHQEWHVSLDRAIDMEAVAQAKLMRTKDFVRAYEAFAAKRKPVFEGD
jgi:enoyl-CoA hydratase/carnithine racemase